MQNAAAVEALYSATFVEVRERLALQAKDLLRLNTIFLTQDYLDCVENLPNDLQRHLSRLREFDLTQYSV